MAELPEVEARCRLIRRNADGLALRPDDTVDYGLTEGRDGKWHERGVPCAKCNGPCLQIAASGKFFLLCRLKQLETQIQGHVGAVSGWHTLLRGPRSNDSTFSFTVHAFFDGEHDIVPLAYIPAVAQG